MAEIYPDIFWVIKRFPGKKDVIVTSYHTSQIFRNMCMDYQQCRDAVRYWSISKNSQALARRDEYEQLLQSLVYEIIDFIQTSSDLSYR